MNLYQVDLPNGKYSCFKYPAGETQVRFDHEEIQKILAADEIHVTARIANAEHLIELCHLTDALQSIAKYPDTEMVLILPYLPYGRADRRFVEGDCFGLKVFGNIINELSYDKVVTVDAHSLKANTGICALVDVSPLSLIRQVLDSFPKKTVILLPDKGAARYGLEKQFAVLHCDKVRDPQTGALLHFNVPSKEQFEGYDNILIVDDICDGGGTFVGIAKKLWELGIAKPAGVEKRPDERALYLYVTHGIFSKGLTSLLEYFNHIYTTDSLYDSKKFSMATSGFVTVLPVGGLVMQNLLPAEEMWKMAVEKELHA